MSRIFIFIVSLVMLLPSSVRADATADQKAQVMTLYKSYRASLKEDDFEAALEFAEQMYALTPKVYGKISKTHATASFNLAQMYEQLHARKEAAATYQEHINILDQLKVPKDEKYLAKLGLLSGAYIQLRENEKALKYMRQELKLAKKLKLPDERIAFYELKMGSSYSMIYGKINNAKGHFDKAYNLYATSLGEDNVNTAFALFWRAKVDMGYKKYSRAAKKFESVLDIYKKILPDGDDNILQTHAFLVKTYEEMGEKEKSTEHCIAVATERPVGFDLELKPLYKIHPEYPHSALLTGKSGYIIAEFTVDKNGEVKDIEVIETTNTVFNKEAVEALSKFRYAPTIRDGKRVDTHGVLHKVTFEITPG